MSDYANPTMFLIYPGTTDFEQVEIIAPAEDHGYVYVRPFNSEDQLKVAVSRLVDEETARRRTHTNIIERKDDMGRYLYTLVEKRVIA